MDFILQLDTQLFYLINVDLANSVSNGFFPFITNVKHWILVYLFGFFWMLFSDNKRGKIALLTLITAIILNDQVTSNFLKEIIGRLRPCHILDNINLLVNCGSGKSFPSAHASNNFAAALVLLHYYPNKKYLFLIIAFLMALSRVFVGVHYPIDILAGGLLGVSIGYLVTKASDAIMEKINTKFIK